MESNPRYTLVGSLVIIFIVMMSTILIWLTKRSPSVPWQEYTILFRESSLTGLQADSRVTMNGIRVGKVREVEIAEDNIELVKAVIEVQPKTPIKLDTKAVIQRNLLTGLATIDLVGGTKNAKLLRRVASSVEERIIPEGRSPVSKIQESLPVLLEQVATLMARAETYLSEENQASASQILANSAKFSSNLATQSERLDEVFDAIRVLIEDVHKVSADISTISADVGKAVPELQQEMSATLADISQAAKRMEKAVKDVSVSANNSMQVVTLEVSNLAQRIGEAAERISATMERLEDPRSIFVGPRTDALGPGESE